jgi:hypothetical protein
LRTLAAALRAVPPGLIAAGRGVPAPRPYPTLIEDGTAWVLSGRYWIKHSDGGLTVILPAFHDQADIPGRHGSDTAR